MAEIERGKIIERTSIGGTVHDAAGREVYFRRTDAARVFVRDGVVVLEGKPHIYPNIPKVDREIVFRRTGPGAAFAYVWAPASFYNLAKASIPSREGKEEAGGR